MSVLRLELRADVLDAVTHGLRGSEGLADVIEDVAYWEAAARKCYLGSGIDESTPIDCAMTGPLEQISVDVPDAPVRMLRESMRPGETFEGLVTALLITEVRHWRTDMHWPLLSADESIMPEDATTIECLVRHHCTTITTTVGGHLMYTIAADVRTDVLAAFDANLEDWEDRSEELAVLIHLEDEVRDYGSALACADAETSTLPTATIDVRLDGHDHAAFERILRGGAEAGILFTALMMGALNGHGETVAQADDPLLTPA